MDDVREFVSYLRRVGREYASSQVTSTARDYADAARTIERLNGELEQARRDIALLTKVARRSYGQPA